MPKSSPTSFKKPRPLSRFFFLFLAICLLTTAAVNYYLLFLLGQDPINTSKVRKTSILLATGILVFILLLIVLFIFFGAVLAKAFASKGGIFSVFFILFLLVVMGLDYAIPPALKRGDVKKARIFAGIASVFGTLLFVIILLLIISKSLKKSKAEGKGKRKEKSNRLNRETALPAEEVSQIDYSDLGGFEYDLSSLDADDLDAYLDEISELKIYE